MPIPVQRPHDDQAVEATSTDPTSPVPAVAPGTTTGKASDKAADKAVAERPVLRPGMWPTAPASPQPEQPVAQPPVAQPPVEAPVEAPVARGAAALRPGMWPTAPTTPSPAATAPEVTPGPGDVQASTDVDTTPAPAAPTAVDGAVPTAVDGGAPTAVDGAAPTAVDGAAPTAVDGAAPTAVDSAAVVETPDVPVGVDPVTGEVDDTYTPVAPAPAPSEPAPSAQPVGQPVVPLDAVADIAGEQFSVEELTLPIQPKPETKAVANLTPKKHGGGRGKKGLQLTERDVAMLTFLGRYRYATYPQLSLRFGVPGHSLRHRFPRLATENLVYREAIGQHAHGVWLPTEKALRIVGLDLPVPTLSWATAAHSIGLVDIGVRFELAGEVVVTEREIRAADSRNYQLPLLQDLYLTAGPNAEAIAAMPANPGGQYMITLGSGEGQYRHFPDLVLSRAPLADGSPQSVAIELELNYKPAAQWRKILRGYKDATHIGLVIYYCNSSDIARAITRAAAEVGAAEKVQIRNYTPSTRVVPKGGRRAS